MSDIGVFLSYSTRDAERVLAVTAALREQGITPWIDQSNIGTGESIVEEIERGLEKSRYFVLFLSHAYLQSEWTREELSAAYYQARLSNERRILIVRLDDAALPNLLAHRRYVTWSDAGSVAAELAAAISAIERAHLGGTDQADGSVLPRSQSLSGTPLRWEDMDKAMLLALAQSFLDRLDEVSSLPDSEVPIVVTVSNTRRIVMTALRLFASNDILIAELDTDLQITRTKSQLAGEFRKELSTGGLGVFGPAFKIKAAEAAEELEAYLDKLRRHMAGLTCRIAEVVDPPS